jgi:hypothetical protein
MGNLGIEVKIISEEYIDIKKIIIIGRWNRGTEDIPGCPPMGFSRIKMVGGVNVSHLRA